MKATIHYSNISRAPDNLAAEELLFRSHGHSSVELILYRNSPSVLIGRNQNPWIECDPRILQREDIALVRRISGGGTVYHDPGNLNYCLIIPRPIYKPAEHQAMIASAIGQTGIEVTAHPKRGLFVKTEKISGTAFMLRGRTALLHGCILVSTDLEKLKRCLTPAKFSIRTKAVRSVASPVINLKSLDPNLTCDSISELIAGEFQNTFGSAEFRSISPQQLEVDREFCRYAEQYRDPEWTFGRTPEFTQELDLSKNRKVRIAVKNGIIQDVHSVSAKVSEGPGDPEFPGFIQPPLKGMKYSDLYRQLT